MVKVEVVYHEKPVLNNPILVGGLPGAGYVGKLAVDHLIKELRAKRFAEIFSHAFPPQVVLNEDGTVELMKNELYYWKNPSNSWDLVLLAGNAQAVSPEGQYAVSERILDIAEELGVKSVYMMAAYITGKYVREPAVYGATTTPDLLEMLKGYGVLPMTGGSITGTNGLLFALAKQRDMGGVCLLGETSGYIVDAKAAQAVLEMLTKILGIQVDMTELEKRARETEAFIKRMEEMERRAMEQVVRRPPSAERELRYIS